MKKILLFALLLCSICVTAQERRNKKRADANTQEFFYEVEAYRNKTLSGSIDVKIWSYAVDINVAKEQATKNAVHAALFRGIPGNQEKRVQALPALVKDISAEQKYKSFFDELLKEHGPYLRYATKSNNAMTTDIIQLAKNRTKVHKYKYKVGVIVTLQYDELKKLLEQKGIIEKLNSGFIF
ncbi:MAG: hypothetical protein E7141_06930 [Rikenellaceae bacterium]|nr:hypothetical protein [Rikenellaceae bacterium]